MQHWRKMTTSVAIVMAAAVITGCGGSGDSNDATESAKSGDGGAFKIGVAASMTGGMAIWDQPAVAGLKMAVDDINARGGLLGNRKIELSIKDTRSEPAQTTVDTKALISSGSDLVVLPCNTDGATAGGRLVQQAKLPAITLCATSSKLRASVGDFMFGPRPSDPIEAIAAAKYAVQEGAKTAFLMPSPDIEYTQNIPKAFEQVFKNLGGTIVGSASFSTGAQDFGAVISRIKNAKPQPDVIQTAMFEPAYPAFLKQLRAAGLKMPIVGASGLDTPSVAALGKVADGNYFPLEAFAKPGSETEAFFEKVAKTAGKTHANVYAVNGYNIGLILEEAVKASNGTDPESIRDGILGIKDLKGVDGNPITFDYPNTIGMPLRPMSIVKFEDGKLESVATVDVTEDDLKAAGF